MISSSKESAPLRVALVGTGRWGQGVLGKLLGFSRVEVVAIADKVHANLSGMLPNEGGKNLAYFQGEHLLREEIQAGRMQVDAVVICGPCHLQAAWAADYLRLGVSVFVEKPGATSELDLERLAQAQHDAATDPVFAVGHLLHFHPIYRCVKDCIAAGTIGQLRAIVSRRWGCRERDSISPLWILAPHDLSMAIAFLGEAQQLSSCEQANQRSWAEFQTSEETRFRIDISPTGPAERFSFYWGERGVIYVDELTNRVVEVTEPIALEQLLTIFKEDEPLTKLREAIQGLNGRELKVEAGDALEEELQAFVVAALAQRTGIQLQLPNDLEDLAKVTVALLTWEDALRGVGKN
ncbi:MAG: Gfo/Idh/MocA family oxidoreductase [Polyangiaceae bacterium]|nr:Gfo/Idh/MocA family oxidoreductase [Polyangiaceae bacterium]